MLVSIGLVATALVAQSEDLSDRVSREVYHLQSDDVVERLEAARHLRQLGDQAQAAIPALIKALGDPEIEVQRAAAFALTTMGPAAKDAVPALMKATKSDDLSLKTHAVVALGNIGPAAKPAIPNLVDILKNAEKYTTRSEAAGALARIGPAAIPALIKLVEDDKDVAVKETAVRALGQIGPPAQSVLPQVLEVAKVNDDPTLRRAIFVAFGQIGLDDKSRAIVIPMLIDALSKDRVEARYNAAYALGRMGAKAKQAIPALKATAKDDKDESVRKAATRALQRMQGS
ncbi:HEAT repeat domain-containing protein [Kolteria novifilia]